MILKFCGSFLGPSGVQKTKQLYFGRFSRFPLTKNTACPSLHLCGRPETDVTKRLLRRDLHFPPGRCLASSLQTFCFKDEPTSCVDGRKNFFQHQVRKHTKVKAGKWVPKRFKRITVITSVTEKKCVLSLVSEIFPSVFSFTVIPFVPIQGEYQFIDIGYGGPAGQVYSTVTDLATVMSTFFTAELPRFAQSPRPCKFSPRSARDMMLPRMLNPDGQSGFGSPFELVQLKGRLLRTKAGNIAGFSSSLVMFPPLRLGVVALVNGNVDASGFTVSPMEILMEAFESWQRTAKFTDSASGPQLPPNPDSYLGNYGESEGILNLPFFFF